MAVIVDENKAKPVSISISEKERLEILRECGKRNKSLSKFVREACKYYMKETNGNE